MMKLYGSLSSPFVRKVRVTMLEKKLDFTLLPDDPWHEDNQVQHSNPLGQVPCVVLESGEALFDSSVIVEYLDALSPVGKLITGTGRERAVLRTWEALADGVVTAAIAVRMERIWPHRSAEQRCEAWIERHWHKVQAGLARLEKNLGEQNFCAGLQFSIADIAVGCCLGWLDFRFPEYTWRDAHPQLKRLLDKLAQRPSFVETPPPAA